MPPRLERRLVLPPELTGCGIGLRGETDGDVPFLRELYLAVRWPELGPTGWSEKIKRTFLANQFEMQSRHYATYYADADFGIVERHDAAIGRLYLHRGPVELRIVDISLMPQQRGAGIGTALLRAVCAEAAAEGKFAGLHVESSNTAQRLYRRLGFQDVGAEEPYRRMEWRP